MTDVRDTDITTPEAETFESDQVQDSQPTGMAVLIRSA